VRLMNPAMIQSLFLVAPDSVPSDFIEKTFEQCKKGKGVAETAMAVDRLTYLPEDLLTKVDRCSMRHALEVRSPFMDHDLVNFTAGLSAAQLFRGRSKRLLRMAFERDLPPWVFRRKKMGFAVPIGQWLRTSLRSMLHDLLFSADSFASDNFQRPVLQQMIREHQHRRQDHGQRLYALLMLELWWRNIRT
jgi:asparagine synthase (glutamine-hydrolysing)